jgi:alginate biosynthesis protein Alg44
MIETQNKKASGQILHEAEITRQHVRYKIPAQIEIDNKRYNLVDWSISGCAIENLPSLYCEESKHAIVKIIFKFDDFTTIIDNISIDFICKKRAVKNSKMVGGRFQNLNPAQMAIFNQIITAYLNGDIITENDIIHAVSKQITYPKKVEKKLEKKKADKLLILIYMTIIFLVTFLLFVAYQRLFVVQTLNAYVDTNITAIRSPYPSYIKYMPPLKKGEKIDTNETLAIAYFVGGGVLPIRSVVKGTIYKIDVLDGEFRDSAEPICMIVPDGSKPYIVAHFEHKYFKKITIGDIAKVRLADGGIIKAKIVSITPAQRVSLEHTKVLANIYNQARDYDSIVLRPLKPLPLKYVDTTVYVTIDTIIQ